MSAQAFQDSWWLFTRARGVGFVLRMLALASPPAALVCTRMAGGSAVVVELCVVMLTGWCVVVPDSHVGLLVVLLVGVGWQFSVDDTTSPWALAAALALLMFHTSLAAASIAAPGAVWSSSMRRRWLRRAGVLAVTCAATWLLVAAVNVYDVTSSAALVVAALVVLALAGLWARDATFDDRVPRPRSSATAPTE
jgi:hypothetical protein